LRIVDCRKGELFGEPSKGGRGKKNLRIDANVSDKDEMSRCRKIAKHWEELWPYIREPFLFVILRKGRRQVRRF
jgi:hypothetical protein